jgi:hypothetical protein
MNAHLKVTIIAAILMIAALIAMPHTPPAHMPPAHNPATPTQIGDYGNGMPLPQEQDQCLAAGGHMANTTDMWFCEEA